MSDESELCRLCANFADYTNAQNLYLRKQRKLLVQIEELVGFKLAYSKELPQLICETCREQTTQAHQFRELCIRVQQHFATVEEDEYSDNHVEKASQKYEKEAFSSFPMEEEVSSNFEVVDEKQANKCEEQVKCTEVPTDEFGDEGVNYTAHGNVRENKEEPSLGLLIEPKRIKTREMQKFNTGTDIEAMINENHSTTKGLLLTSKANTSQQMLRRSNDRQFDCEFCVNKMHAHTRIHTGEKPYQRNCKSCKQSVHSTAQVRPFVCALCSGAFKSAVILRDHRVTHSSARNFACEICNVTFKLRKNLAQHYRSRLHKEKEQKHQHT